MKFCKSSFIIRKNILNKAKLKSKNLLLEVKVMYESIRFFFFSRSFVFSFKMFCAFYYLLLLAFAINVWVAFLNDELLFKI